MIIITLIISLAYSFLIINLLKHWDSIPKPNFPNKHKSDIKLSVIIIARNEEANIKNCLVSILKNDYPESSYEIIVVDDHSEDQTIQEIKSLSDSRITVLHLKDFITEGKTNAFKKKGIEYALQHVKHDYIIHTDADCQVPTNWLKITAWNFENGIKLQAGPITFSPLHGFLAWFQQLDMYTLMASTNAGIRSKNWYLANGANLAYSKKDLPEHIYKESYKYASGDDVYLINQFAEKYSEEIHFEASIPIITSPVSGLNNFINQRKRWAGKNRELAKGKMKNILIIPVIANLWIFILTGFLFYYPTLGIPLLGFYIICKLMVDYILLDYMQKQTQPTNPNKSFLIASIAYPFYFLGIGIVSQLTQAYQWKSRKVN